MHFGHEVSSLGNFAFNFSLSLSLSRYLICVYTYLHFGHEVSSFGNFAFTFSDLSKLPRQPCSFKLHVNFPLGHRPQCLPTKERERSIK